MNKTYIKRQLSLYNIGIPINEDIQKRYEFFSKLVGNRQKISKLDLDKTYSIFKNENDEVLFLYYSDVKRLSVNYDIIWNKFKNKFNLSWYDEICKWFLVFIEYMLSIEINNIESVSILPNRIFYDRSIG